VLYSPRESAQTMNPNRTAATENFPVGSRLLPRALRPTVAAFYAFARAADDIADDPQMPAQGKLELLDALDRALTGETGDHSHSALARAAELRTIFLERRLALDHPRHLLIAFRADAVNRPCRTWSDLLAYCRYSANPVGRFLLDLHEEDMATYPAADALCTALQILNHIQDCGDDYRLLQRVYVPAAWLDEHGLTARSLLAPRETPELRAIVDQMLDGVDRLNDSAAALPGLIKRRGLRMETMAILAISRKLAAKLRRKDPFARRVALSDLEKLSAVASGVIMGWAR
jgi:hydroxysqualene synthase